jgi:hypothetical protein
MGGQKGSGRGGASFETPSSMAPQDEVSLCAIYIFLILRRVRSTRLEGRTMLVQRDDGAPCKGLQDEESFAGKKIRLMVSLSNHA